MSNYYEALKLSLNASQDEIAISFETYKNTIRSFGPGVNLSDEELKNRNPETWIAYTVLMNVDLRKEYNEKLERDRIHRSYEAKLLNANEGQYIKNKQHTKWFFSLAIIFALIFLYYLSGAGTKDLNEFPKWRTNYLGDSFYVMLPSEPDTLINPLPPYLLNYIKRNKNYYSELKDGFNVSVSVFELGNDFKMSPKDIAYVGSKEMQNSHLRNIKKDTSIVRMMIRGYRLQLERGHYQIDDVLRAYENYTLINGSSAIKLIINYVPENKLHEKYCHVISVSLFH